MAGGLICLGTTQMTILNLNLSEELQQFVKNQVEVGQFELAGRGVQVWG